MKTSVATLSLCGLAASALAASGPDRLGEELVKAAGKGNLSQVRELMGGGASINAPDIPVPCAARSGGEVCPSSLPPVIDEDRPLSP
jgi:hypothetical protein